MISPFFLSMMFAQEYHRLVHAGTLWLAGFGPSQKGQDGQTVVQIDAVWVKMIDFKIFNPWPVDSYT
jgi:hypothetical protein